MDLMSFSDHGKLEDTKAAVTGMWKVLKNVAASRKEGAEGCYVNAISKRSLYD